MRKSIEVTAKTVDEAIRDGLKRLDMQIDDVDVKILSSGGLFRKAKVELFYGKEFELSNANEKSQMDSRSERAEAKPEAKFENKKSEVKFDNKSEKKAEAKPDVKFENKKSEARFDNKPEKKAEVKPDVKFENKKFDNKSDNKFEQKSQQKSDFAQKSNSSEKKSDSNAKNKDFGNKKRDGIEKNEKHKRRERETIAVTDEHLSKAKEFLDTIFKLSNIEAVTKAESLDGVNIVIETADSVVIGHRGDTLDALQYLTSIVVNTEDKYLPLSVDALGYRAKRIETLKRLADKTADKVITNNRKMSLEPMSSAERKIIHAHLSENLAIATRSEGSEPNRRVALYPARNQDKRS